MRSVPLLIAVGAALALAPAAQAFTVTPSAAATPTPLAPVRDAASARQHYARNDEAKVSRADVARFLPLYQRAARRYDVPWLLLAAIHKQETAFSTAPGTYHGLNWVGCCAGPMQFNVTNGPVSTWKQFRHAHLDAPRFADYPHPTRRHPSVYDDFDAIMAAGKLLKANGATPNLDVTAWRAAYLYYGPGDLGPDDFGTTYANEVVARAVNWARRGFNPDATAPRGLVAAVAGLYQPPPPKKKHMHHKHKHHSKKHKAHKVRGGELRSGHGRQRSAGSDGARRARPGRKPGHPHVRPGQRPQQPAGGTTGPTGPTSGGRGPDAGGQPSGVGGGHGGVLPDGSGGAPLHGATSAQGPVTPPPGGAPAADPGGQAQSADAGAG
jgi:hypothetical protein